MHPRIATDQLLHMLAHKLGLVLVSLAALAL
jgi:hypothetical protein